MLCATSCYVTIGSVYDTLTSVTEDGKFVPYLADSVTPNADYTVWTFHARDGVKFHDGTPFDGAAMVDNMKRQIASFLTGKVFSDVATNADGSPQVVLTDPMTMTITMKRPWVVFPLYLAAQPGMIASPTWLAAADKDPTLESKPVGTGPFIFKDYKPGESFTATKNPDYWNKPYPYLDEFETRRHPRRPDPRVRARGRRRRPDPDHERRHDQEVPWRGRQVPDARGDRLRRDGVHPAQRGRPDLTAHGRASALCDGLRHRQPGDHRQGRCRRLDARERSVLTGAARSPRRQRLPAEAGHGQGARSSSRRTRPTIRGRSRSACRRRKTRRT